MKILIIEDEYNLALVIKERLIQEKYSVDIATDGEDGLYSALTDIYDVILLDIMLPHMSGVDILRELRRKKIKSKIIMLTAKYEIENKLECLTKGADDYITKPFHIEELVARINVQLRKNDSDKKTIKFEDIILDVENYKLYCERTNESIDMIKKEFLLLEYLMYNSNQVLSKEQISDKVWGIDNTTESNNIEAYVSFIRRKLKAVGSIVVIKSLRNIGYKLEVMDEKSKK